MSLYIDPSEHSPPNCPVTFDLNILLDSLSYLTRSELFTMREVDLRMNKCILRYS